MVPELAWPGTIPDCHGRGDFTLTSCPTKYPQIYVSIISLLKCPDSRRGAPPNWEMRGGQSMRRTLLSQVPAGPVSLLIRGYQTNNNEKLLNELNIECRITGGQFCFFFWIV